MEISEEYMLGNTIVRLVASGVLSPRVQPQVVVRIRFTGFNSSANRLSTRPTTINRFRLGQIPSPRALPAIVSFVGARIHGVHSPDCEFCNVLLRRFFSQAAAQMMAGLALELLVHMGLLLGPRESDQDVEILGDWMLENPQEEEMAGAVYDYDLYDDVDAGHGGFVGVTASRSFIDGLQRSPYGSRR